jgi:hypothetical protein
MEDEKEEWKLLPDYYHATKYEVSNLGNIRNKISGKLLKLDRDRRVHLTTDDSKPINKVLAFLVAEIYNENPQNYPYIKYLNGNPLDLRSTNLQWTLLKWWYKVPERCRRKYKKRKRDKNSDTQEIDSETTTPSPTNIDEKLELSKLAKIGQKLQKDGILKGNHLIISPKRNTDSVRKRPPTRKNELNKQEAIYSIYYRFLYGSHDKKSFYLSPCPQELDCILHVRKFHQRVQKDVPVPYPEATDDEVLDFEERIMKLVDQEESKESRIKTGLSTDCQFIARKHYHVNDTEFRNPPSITFMSRQVAICRARYCLQRKILDVNPNQKSIRECHHPRCLKHLLGFRKAKDENKNQNVVKEHTVEQRNKLVNKLLDLIYEVDGDCFTVHPSSLSWDGRPAASILFLGRRVSPYIAAWCLDKNNGQLPPKMTDGERTFIIHDDNFCLRRPNCINPLHLSQGNHTLNVKETRYRRGEKNHKAVFSDEDKFKILKMVSEGFKTREISSKFQEYTYLQISCMIYTERQKLKT